MTRNLSAFLFISLSLLAAQSPSSAPVATQFDSLHFRSIGPAVMSGRFTDFAVYERKPSTYYIASAHSGLWKTTNDGVTFTAQFQDLGLMSIGDVTISQSNPDLVWVGTGEGNNRQSSSWGDGIYKSTDGGRTFQNMGLRQSFHVNRIAIDPADNNVVYVAAQGSLFGPGGDRGVFKTSDGGATWKAVLTVDADTGASELAMDPTNNRILYASTYARRRSQCCFNGGGPGSGLWKSIDAGETWTRLKNGLPSGPLGRIGFDIYRRSPNVIYALVEAESAAGGRGAAGAAAPAPNETGLYRSDDAGGSWRKISATNPRPMYFSQVRIDPNNPERLIVANVQIMLSTDGGRTFAQADPTIHDDTHAIWWDPADSDHILIGTDGGVGATWDLTKAWRFLPNLATGLFYHVGYDMDTPYNVCGGMQDNDVWCGPSAIRTQRGIYNEMWSRLQIGDGVVAIADQIDSRIIYSETQDGSIQRKNKITGESKTIRPGPANVTPTPAAGETYRWNWDTPLVFSPHDPHVLLTAANRVFKSTDRGDSWAVISPDLTTNANRADLTIMGVKDSDVRISPNDGISSWPTIVSLAESPKQPGLYYTGTDDGVVSVSRDAGRTWQNVTAGIPGFPGGAWVSEVVPSRFEAGTVYVTVDAHRLNDFDTHIWVSHDFGATFQNAAADLKGEVVKTLTEDLKNPDVLYAGTETGIFLTTDRGRSWARLKANFPTVRVDEITLHPRDNAMIVATHGRAIWILDHLEPIQEYAAAHASDRAALFSIPRALEWKPTNDRNMEFWGDNFYLGENPPADTVIQFNLNRPAADVTLKIADSSGKDIRTLPVGARSQPGIQTMCWDLRVEPLPAPGGAPGRGGRAGGAGATPPAAPTQGPNAGFSSICGAGGRGGGNSAGPYVLPGAYSVSLLVDGAVADTKTMKVAANPAVQMTDAQQKRYYEVVMDLHELQRRGESAANAMTPLYTQMVDIAAKLPAMTNVPASVKTDFDALNKQFDVVRVKFGVPAPAAGAGRGGGRGGPAASPENVVARVTALKSQLLAFWEVPSETLMKQYADVKVALPRALADDDAFLLKAKAVSQTLRKYDIHLGTW